jgi:hypothetical protein
METKTAAAIALLLIMLSLGAGCSVPQYRTLSYAPVLADQRIASLELGQSIHGSFFLGIGEINQNTYYYYYVMEPDGAYSLEKARTDYSKIYMDTSPENAHVVISYADSTPITCSSDVSDAECIRTTWIFKKDYNFHVPNGTIIQKYNGNVGGSSP